MEAHATKKKPYSLRSFVLPYDEKPYSLRAFVLT